MKFPSIRNFNNITPSPFSPYIHNHTYPIQNNNSQTVEKEHISTSNKEENIDTSEKRGSKNFSFDILDKLLSHIEGDDLIILGVICLLYKKDDCDIFLIIVLFLLLFDI